MAPKLQRESSGTSARKRAGERTKLLGISRSMGSEATESRHDLRCHCPKLGLLMGRVTWSRVHCLNRSSRAFPVQLPHYGTACNMYRFASGAVGQMATLYRTAHATGRKKHKDLEDCYFSYLLPLSLLLSLYFSIRPPHSLEQNAALFSKRKQDESSVPQNEISTTQHNKAQRDAQMNEKTQHTDRPSKPNGTTSLPCHSYADPSCD